MLLLRLYDAAGHFTEEIQDFYFPVLVRFDYGGSGRYIHK